MADTEPNCNLSPPHNPQAEQATLGAMLRDNAVISTVLSSIREDHFYADAHRKIFRAIVALYRAGQPVDLVTLANRLKDQGTIEDVRYAYLGELWDAVPTAANAEFYTRIVRNHATRRNLIHLSQEIQREAYSPTGPVEELVGRAKSIILAAGQAGIAPPTRLRLPEPYRPFPVDAFPEPIRSYVSHAAAALGCDPAYVALPVLSVVASAIGNTRTIRLKRGWEEPCIVWSAIVGESGTLKTPAYLRAVGHLYRVQKRFRAEYKQKVASYQDKVEEYKAAKQKWKKREDGARDPGDPPEEPVLRRVLCSDTTIEKLAEILEDNPRGTLLARDELSAWLGSFGRYKGKQGGTDLPNWLEMFRAGTVIVDRKTGERRQLFIEQAAVSVTGSIQPGVLARALTPEFLDAGLAARLLLATPVAPPKRWSEVEVASEAESAYQNMLDRLLSLDFARDGKGEKVPHILHLSAEAKAAWVAFYNQWAQEQAAAEGELAAALSKLEAYAARLALLHHVVTWVGLNADDLGDVGPESVEAGVTLCCWFAAEARRLYATFSENDAERTTRKLVEHIEARGGHITARELQRSNSRKYPDAQAAEAALNELVEDGLATWDEAPSTSQGGRPTRHLRLHPTHDNTDATPGRPANGDGCPADTTTDSTPPTLGFSRGIGGCVGIVMRRTDGKQSETEAARTRGSVGREEVVSDGEHGDAWEGNGRA